MFGKWQFGEKRFAAGTPADDFIEATIGTPVYNLWLFDANGVRQGLISDYQDLTWRLAEYGLGSFTFTLHKDSPNLSLATVKYRLAITRNGRELLWGYVGRRSPRYTREGKPTEYVEVSGVTYTKQVLASRLCVPDSGDKWQSFAGRPDDVIKDFVRYNATVLATDTGRAWPGLTVVANTGQARSTASYAKWSDDGVFSNLTNAIDGDTSTTVDVSSFVAGQDYIFIGHDSPFNALVFDFTTYINTLTSALTVQCSDGAGGWLACTLDSDGTTSSGRSMGQDGTIEFTPHSAWAADTVDGVAGQYWVRLSWSADWSTTVRIAEIDALPIIAARYHNLLDRLVDIAERYDVDFEVAGQWGSSGNPLFRTTYPMGLDRTQGNSQGNQPVILSAGRGVVAGLDYRLDYLGVVNAVYSGAAGDGRAQVVREVEDATSQTNWFRAEAFVSAGHTTDPAVIDLAAEELLDRRADPTEGLRFDFEETEGLRFQRDFNIGDRVTFYDHEWSVDETVKILELAGRVTDDGEVLALQVGVVPATGRKVTLRKTMPNLFERLKDLERAADSIGGGHGGQGVVGAGGLGGIPHLTRDTLTFLYDVAGTPTEDMTETINRGTSPDLTRKWQEDIDEYEEDIPGDKEVILAGDYIIRLGDALGAKKVKVRDSGNNDVLTIDSDGNLRLMKSATSGITLNADETGTPTLDAIIAQVERGTGDNFVAKWDETTDAHELDIPGDFVIKLGDAIGAKKVSIRDSGDVEVADIDSDGNATFNTVNAKGQAAFSISGTLSVDTDPAPWFIASVALTISDVRIAVKTAPTGASIIIDIDKSTDNGSTWTTIFTTQANRPEIAAGTRTDTSGAPDVTAVAKDDMLRIAVDQVGSTVAGADLTVSVRVIQ